jgi:hypothetical protein
MHDPQASWSDVVWWQGPDAEGCVWVVVQLSRAVARARRGEPLVAAIVSAREGHCLNEST